MDSDDAENGIDGGEQVDKTGAAMLWRVSFCSKSSVRSSSSTSMILGVLVWVRLEADMESCFHCVKMSSVLSWTGGLDLVFRRERHDLWSGMAVVSRMAATAGGMQTVADMVKGT